MFCPDGHGRLLETTSGRLYCPHVAHDGRPKTHPLGSAPATRAFFTFAEVMGWPQPASTKRSRKGR